MEEAYMADDYSLSNLLNRMYLNQLALEAGLMELTLHLENSGATVTGRNVRGALETIGENAGYIKQGIARLKAQEAD